MDEISLTFERVGHLSRGKPTNPHSIGQQRAFDVNFWSAVKGSDSKFKPVVREVRRNLKQTEDRNPNIPIVIFNESEGSGYFLILMPV